MPWYEAVYRVSESSFGGVRYDHWTGRLKFEARNHDHATLLAREDRERMCDMFTRYSLIDVIESKPPKPVKLKIVKVDGGKLYFNKDTKELVGAAFR